jgi:hypothetical protein
VLSWLIGGGGGGGGWGGGGAGVGTWDGNNADRITANDAVNSTAKLRLIATSTCVVLTRQRPADFLHAYGEISAE